MKRPTDCPVLPLAHEYDQLTRAYRDIDCGKVKPNNPDMENMIIWDRLDAIMWQATYLRPETNDGAAFQIMLASTLLDRACDGKGKPRRREAVAQVQRLLYALVGYLSSGDQRMADARQYLMGSHIDPLARLGEIVERGQ